MPWEIYNANGWRWGRDSYPTRKAAGQALRDFYTGWRGMKFDRFTIIEVSGRTDEQRERERRQAGRGRLAQ